MIIHTAENAISRLPHVQLDSSFPFRDIVHMVLAGGPSQTLYNLSSGVHQRAVDFLCSEELNAIAEDTHGRPYFSQDPPWRPNESLGILSVSGVRMDRTAIVTSRGNRGTLEDLADSAMNTFGDDSLEKSWSLMLFSVHPGVTSEWHNEKGELQSAERILQMACSLPYGKGACFGTHHLEGISFAIHQFCLQQDLEPSQLSGVWQEAYEYVVKALTLMKRNQGDDGSLQRAWFRSKKLPSAALEWRETIRDLASLKGKDAALVYATGHCLDAVSAIGEFLSEDRDWIQQACYILAQTIETHWINVGRNIGPVTHAIHALKLLDV